MSKSFVLCLTTVNSSKKAEKMAAFLVKKRLAACVSVVPGLTSFYHWKKKFCREKEVLLFIKTKKTMVLRLERELLKIHPYELPEFVVLPISGGFKKYFSWISESLTK